MLTRVNYVLRTIVFVHEYPLQNPLFVARGMRFSDDDITAINCRIATFH